MARPVVARALRALFRLNPTSRGRYRLATLGAQLAGGAGEVDVPLRSGARLRFDLGDPLEAAMYFDAFEYVTRRALLGPLRDGDVLLDIGANIGFFSLLALDRITPSGKVIAVEPNPQLAARLRQYAAHYGAERLQVHECALGEQPGEVELFLPADETHGHASLAPQGWDRFRAQRVRMAVLDELLRDEPKVTALKLDVEGAELGVIRGAEASIRRWRPRIMIEVNEKAAAAMGHACFAAVHELMRIHPDYRIQALQTHGVVPVDYAGIETLPWARDTNLLLT